MLCATLTCPSLFHISPYQHQMFPELLAMPDASLKRVMVPMTKSLTTACVVALDRPRLSMISNCRQDSPANPLKLLSKSLDASRAIPVHGDQLTRHPRTDRLTSLRYQHTGIIIKSNHMSIFPLQFLCCSHHDSMSNIASSDFIR